MQRPGTPRPQQPQEAPKVSVHHEEVKGIHGMYDLYATVTRGFAPMKDVPVEFRMDGKVIGHAVTNAQGKAYIELEIKPKIEPRQPNDPIVYHAFAIVAKIVNTDISSSTDSIHALPKEDEPLTPGDHIRMVIFWGLFLVIGPGTLFLRLPFLLLTILITKRVGKARGKNFKCALWEENNWVVLSIIGMSIICGFMSHMNPIDYSVSALFHPGWGFMNKLFFGNLGGDWSQACKHLAIGWGFLATIVSAWDNVVVGFKKRSRKKVAAGGHEGMSFASKFAEHFKFDSIFGGITIILKALWHLFF